MRRNILCFVPPLIRNRQNKRLNRIFLVPMHCVGCGDVMLTFVHAWENL